MPSSKPDWLRLIKKAPKATLAGQLWRMVESQSQVATIELVDSLQEQAILEQLIEVSKPPRPESAENLHYLLATPFRYPPLRWGSRFGQRHEPSIFYGSLTAETVFAEAAYYRLLFWFGMADPPPEQQLITQHELFSARYRCSPGLKLQKRPFDRHYSIIAHRKEYGMTQVLGAAMRAVEVQGFEFPSARCPDSGINIGLFTPSALAGQRPDQQQRWVCEIVPKMIRFRGEGRLVEFPWDLFFVGGALPRPD